ncbi:MAG: type II secretion system protein F, partial [Salinibacterium sp.]|nr:type II secretion system protein F [Salinibacterium sp.]
MSVAVGLLMGAGLVLASSHWLWPRRSAPVPRAAEVDVFRIKELLVQAGLPSISPATFAAGAALVGIAMAALTFALLPVTALAVAAGAAASAAPLLMVTWRARRRRRALRMVWPDVVDQLISAVRSGLALPDSLATLSRSGPSGTREPFRLFEADYRLTGNFSLCLDALKVR